MLPTYWSKICLCELYNVVQLVCMHIQDITYIQHTICGLQCISR